jgi:hypothetical protein
MRLKELQKQFATQIYDPQNTEIERQINSSAIAKDIRVEIYRNNVFGNFSSVLGMVYPVIQKLVGDDFFEDLCVKYRNKYPSPSGNLDDYGQQFPKMIGTLKNQHKLAYLKDIANLEWKFHRAYFSRNVADFPIQKFQKLKEEELSEIKFKLHPSCVLIASQFPIFSIWESVESQRKLDLNQLLKESVLVERSRFDTNIQNLTEHEFLFLKNIKKGLNLYQIYEEISPNFADFDIGSLMNKFISNGVIASYGI